MARTLLLLTAILIFAAPLWAQSSPSFTLEESRLNQGGNPTGGAILQSTSFRVTLDALGDAVGAPGPLSASYTIDSGPETARPPGEVVNLRFTTKTALTWDPEPSVGTYNLYRALRADLATGPGSCLAPGLTAPAGSDADAPASGVCWFYLVTAENRLREEGTSGRDSAGTPRPNPTPCP